MATIRTSSASAPPFRRWRFVRSILLWLILYAVSVTIYNHTYDVASEWLIGWVQIRPAVFLLEQILPEVPLRHTATSIRGAHIDLLILRGCDGIEAWLLLITALLVFPGPWRRRLAGMGLGTVLIFALNLVRIVSLFLIALKWPAWMDLAHGLIWQSVITLTAAMFVLVWLAPREDGAAPGARGTAR